MSRQPTWFYDELARVWLLAELAVRNSSDLAPILGVRATHCGSADLAILAATSARATRRVHARRASTPLARLELSVLEAEILIIALALHADSTLADSFQVLNGGTHRGVTPAAVRRLLRLGPAAHARLLATLACDARLVRDGLIEIDHIIHPTCAALALLDARVPLVAHA